jgi:hypothetical protein
MPDPDNLAGSPIRSIVQRLWRFDMAVHHLKSLQSLTGRHVPSFISALRWGTYIIASPSIMTSLSLEVLGFTLRLLKRAGTVPFASFRVWTFYSSTLTSCGGDDDAPPPPPNHTIGVDVQAFKAPHPSPCVTSDQIARRSAFGPHSPPT